MGIKTTQERLEKLVRHRDTIIDAANLKGAEIPVNSDFPAIIAGIQRITLGLDTAAVEAILNDILDEVIEGDYTIKGQAIETSKEAIRQAIISKSIDIPEGTPLSQYPEKIGEIETGSETKIPVHFFDTATGEIITTVFVESGGNATPPEIPVHEHLTFKYWKGSYQNVTRERYVGSIYEVNEEATILFIDLLFANVLTQTLRVWKDAVSDILTIDWGDGTTTESSETGNLSFAHTWPSVGSYKIKITCTAIYKMGSTSTGPIFSTSISSYSNILCKAYLPKTANFNSLSFSNNINLKAIVLSDGITALSTYCFGSSFLIKYVALPNSITNLTYNGLFRYNYALIALLLPDGATTIGDYILGNNMSYVEYIDLPANLSVGHYMFSESQIKDVELPDSLTHLGVCFFQKACRLTKIDLPASVIALNTSTFDSCVALKTLIVRSVNPPSMTSNSLSNTPQTLRIYVPDASVTTYKTAAYWAAYANRIYPISQMPG